MLDSADHNRENSRWLVDGVDLVDRVAEVPNRATTCRVCDSDSQNDHGFARQTGTMAVCPVQFLSTPSYRSTSSAICTALRAAPFRSWSPQTQNAKPFSNAQSIRRRPTAQAFFPEVVRGIG